MALDKKQFKLIKKEQVKYTLEDVFKKLDRLERKIDNITGNAHIYKIDDIPKKVRKFFNLLKKEK
jgi:hypothetical protein